MSAEIINFPRQPQERPLSYRELRTYLHQQGHNVSRRWLQDRVAEGMPCEGTDYAGRKVFLPSRVESWLDEWAKQKGRAS